MILELSYLNAQADVDDFLVYSQVFLIPFSVMYPLMR